jgi:hypothetical protein
VQVIKRAVRNVYEMGLEDFIFGHPAQIALLGIQYQWTADTQVCWGVARRASGETCSVRSGSCNTSSRLYWWWHASALQMQLSGSVTYMEPTDQLCIAWCCVQTVLTSAKTDKTVMGRNMKKTDALLRDMVMITLRTDLTRIQRTNLETCITVHMHQKESTEDLVRKKVCTA